MTSILDQKPPKIWSFPIKTKVKRVPGIYPTGISDIQLMVQPVQPFASVLLTAEREENHTEADLPAPSKGSPGWKPLHYHPGSPARTPL